MLMYARDTSSLQGRHALICLPGLQWRKILVLVGTDIVGENTMIVKRLLYGQKIYVGATA